MNRALWIFVGSLALVLGIIGAVLPLLPTTPFLLVAAFAFSKSSPRLHAWLTRHPRLGPPIRDWNREGAISRPAKTGAVAMMIAAFAISLAVGVSGLILTIQALVLTGVAVFVLSRPTPTPTTRETESTER